MVYCVSFSGIKLLMLAYGDLMGSLVCGNNRLLKNETQISYYLFVNRQTWLDRRIKLPNKIKRASA